MIKKLYLHPNDSIVIHVIDDPDAPKTKAGWAAGSSRPYAFTARIEAAGLSVTDPILDIGLIEADGTRRRYVPQRKRAKKDVE